MAAFQAITEAGCPILALFAKDRARPTINGEYGKYSAQIAEQDQHLGKIRQRAQWAYLALYLFGSVTLLRALKYE